MSHLQKINDNGYSWYECSCCPYGYHVDLDFVRYCESVTREIDRSCNESNKRRKDRRQQRQSMEVLLGITPPPIYDNLPTHPENYRLQEPTNHHTFDDAVSDFERTLQRFKKNKIPPNNLPDVTAVSESIKRVPSPSPSSMSSHSGSSSMTVLPEANNKDFDSVSIESCGLSPSALQNIREQMALSLERTRNLENQVKLIPDLEAELLKVKEENLKLLLRLKEEEITKLNSINANYLQYQNRVKSQSFTDIDSLEERIREPPPPPPRKDFGVMCGVLTRNVGVGHQSPNTKSVSTTTFNGNLDYTDKWYNEKVKFLNLIDKHKSSTQSTQTFPKDNRTIASQTIGKQGQNQIDSYSQTTKKCFIEKGVTVSPVYTDFGAQKTVECYNIGVSDDNICDIICEKCNIPKLTIGVGPDKYEDSHTLPISLANLMVPRSKSFTLTDDKLNFKSRNRTVACQYEIKNTWTAVKATQCESTGVSKASQYDIKNQSKSCQSEIKHNHKATQVESHKQVISKNTDTKDLVVSKNVACEVKQIKETRDVACNTTTSETTSTSSTSSTTCTTCIPAEKSKDGSPTPSRIPRPQVPTTPVEARKFKRQDTYTKVYDRPLPDNIESYGLSGLDLSLKLSEPLDKVKQNLKLSEASSAQNGINKVQIQENTLPHPETVIYQPGQRKKCIPSKEMQAAMKVLNDCLQKSQTKNLKNTSAITVIQQEWFKISSLVTANPLDVEDYLDAFEEISSALLQYIVNMSDDSGNTAMHYAVSHGNFDVVSILLDSKVCDINRTNKAGYTCVMLVSLAEVRSTTHANVVRKLFQLADVNLRAKQHGQTALMLAVSHGRLDMVKMLLEAGADINIQDEDGSTALMCAAEHGHVEIVKHFLSHPDCNSGITDVDGSTALKIAMEAGHRHIGVLLYAHERNLPVTHTAKAKKSKPSSPKTPSSPLPIRSSHRALTDTKMSTNK